MKSYSNGEETGTKKHYLSPTEKVLNFIGRKIFCTYTIQHTNFKDDIKYLQPIPQRY